MDSGSRPPGESGPESPEGPQAPAPQAPPYTPIPDSPETPPGGWDQPVATAGPGWEGRQLASWWSRVGAAVLDWLILLVPVTALTVLVVDIALDSTLGGIAAGVASGLLYLVVLLFYAPVLMAREGKHNGQTWGKQIVGITVVRDSGARVDFGFGFLREVVVKGLLFGVLGVILFFGIPTLVNYLWPLWDDQNRCLHDMVVKTHVVRV